LVSQLVSQSFSQSVSYSVSQFIALVVTFLVIKYLHCTCVPEVVEYLLFSEEIISFSDITEDSETVRKIKDVYQERNNVDLWVGGLAEDHEHGSELGPTFRTIVTRNFLRIRDGDRFWYERLLTKEEIDKVHSLTLGAIIRLNTGFKSAPDNVFFSTQYCASVENFQCARHNENLTGRCENIQRRLRSLEQDLRKRKEGCDARTSVTDGDTSSSSGALTTGLVVVCIIFVLVAVVLFVLSLKLWFRLRQPKLKTVYSEDKTVELEMQHQPKKQNLVCKNPATIS